MQRHLFSKAGIGEWCYTVVTILSFIHALFLFLFFVVHVIKTTSHCCHILGQTHKMPSFCLWHMLTIKIWSGEFCLKYTKLMQRNLVSHLEAVCWRDPSVCRQAKYFLKHTTPPHPWWAAAPGFNRSVTQVRELSYCRIWLLLNAADEESSGCSPKAECLVRDFLYPPTSRFLGSGTEL